MKNNKKKERSIVILLIVAVLLMTVGFALYSTTLNINGNVTVKGSPWDVRYIKNQIDVTEGSVTKDVTASVDDTNFAFTVTLEKPGDFYEAKITAKNFGTVPAKLTGITMTGITDDNKDYLSYKVTYNGKEYTASASGLDVAMASLAEHPVIVRVEYKKVADTNLLPKQDVQVTVTGKLNYEDTLPTT